jgi:mycothiol synthase
VPDEILIQTATNRADLAAWAAVKKQVDPLDRVTVEELEHDLDVDPATRLLLASIHGDVVASAIGKSSKAMPDTLFAMVRVLPARRRRGAGTALFDALTTLARERGLGYLFGRIDETDVPSLDWAARRGLTEIARESELLLTLADVAHGAPPVAPEGIELVSLADRPDLTEDAYRIQTEADQDIPGPFPLQHLTFDEWKAENVSLPGFQASGSFVALLNGEQVGYAGLAATDASLAHHLLTGVLRAARGRGIATALKLAQIDWARRAGFEQLVTWTSSRNDPMRAINLKLGYVEQPASITVRGPVRR